MVVGRDAGKGETYLIEADLSLVSENQRVVEEVTSLPLLPPGDQRGAGTPPRALLPEPLIAGGFVGEFDAVMTVRAEEMR
ncbi:hypothetical protein AB0I77_46210 [Streptomyces sp. NPDC050619]|uniref:hypothetical protein n=1 Tax=Streptomyces sp. NPDC050619 TaxID=3157214 RepID=UPI003422F440